jgi:hypothetical protein
MDIPTCIHKCRSRWSRRLMRRSAAARLLGLRVRIPPGARMSLANVGCCRVDVSATGRSLDQRSPTGCGMTESDVETSTMWRRRCVHECCATRHKMHPLHSWYLGAVSLSRSETVHFGCIYLKVGSLWPYQCSETKQCYANTLINTSYIGDARYINPWLRRLWLLPRRSK